MTVFEIYRTVEDIDGVIEKLEAAFEDDSPFMPKREAVDKAVWSLTAIRNNLCENAEKMKGGDM